MASRGFEFAYNIDGTNSPPMTRDFTLGVAAAHLEGDAMLVQSDGYVDAVTGTTTEVTGIMAEAKASGDVTAGTTLGKMYIVQSHQVWMCSMDAATTTAEIGYDKTIDTADKNTIDADDLSNGRKYFRGDQDIEHRVRRPGQALSGSGRLPAQADRGHSLRG